MERLNISKITEITCNFSSEDWQLSNVPPDEIVEDLNFELELLVNTGYSRRDVRSGMCLIMKSYSEYGAEGIAAKNFLNSVLDIIFAE